MPSARLLLLTATALVATTLPTLTDANQRVLLYTAVESDGFYHPSIPTAVRALKDLGEQDNIDLIHCNDRNDFEDLDLSQFDALAFVNAAGSVLTNKGAKNMREYIQNGGGYVGVHEASCAATSIPWYLRLVGSQFTYHPAYTEATMDILDQDHPSTQHLGSTWVVHDEIYNFASNPRKLGATVGVAADESTYWDEIQPQKARAAIQGSPHPISWWREGDLLTAPKHALGGGLDNSKKDIRKGIQGTGGPGRSWYTGLGHSAAAWRRDDFLQHVWGGLTWVLDSTTIKSNQLSPGPDTPGQKYNGTITRKGPSTSSTASGAGAAATLGSAGLNVTASAQRANDGSSSGAAAMFARTTGPSPAAAAASVAVLSVVLAMATHLCLL